MESPKEISKARVTRKTIISFAAFIIFFTLVILGWNRLHKSPKDNGALKPLRTALNANEKLFNKTFSVDRLSKTFPKSAAVKNARVNGSYGLRSNLDSAAWKLKIIRAAGDTLFISLDEIKTLPKTEVIFNFKCIEGWSQITDWAGVRFSDFVKHYGLDSLAALNYTGLETPDRGYYVGIDRKSMWHPQTILCYELNDAPLPMNQGYPLRLIIPVKYGIKHLKRIGTISFSNEKPRDYWYERGYDYYSGL